MYKIGNFSKLTRITVKMLRHYDKIDLLKPGYVDQFSKYRFYLPTQLKDAYKIVVLKDLGLFLLEIKKIIHNQTDIDAVINSLENKIELYQANVKLTFLKISQIKSYVKILKEENNMKYDVIIKSIPEVIVASMRTKIKNYNEFNTIYPAMGEYMASQKVKCLEPGYCFTIYYDNDFRTENIDVEICESVIAFAKDSEEIKFKKVPGYDKVASTMHKGSYQTLGNAYNAIFTWIKENNYQIIDNPREVYYDGIWNKESEDEYLTEIQIPIK